MFIKREYIEKIFPNHTKLNMNDLIELSRNLHQLPISEQFNVVFSSKQMFQNKCFVLRTTALNKSDEYVSCETISKIRISVSLNRLCYTLFSQINKEVDDRYLVEYDVNTGNFDKHLILIYLSNTIKQLYIYFHSRNKYIYDDFDPNYLEIVRRNEDNQVHFYKTQINLMPKPYQTSCFDYRLKGYHSREDCIFRCKTEYYEKAVGKWPQFYYAFDSNSHLYNEQNHNFSLDQILSEKCGEICGHNSDCFKEYFKSFERKFYLIYDNDNKTSFKMLFSAPTTPNMVITHSPKIQVEEFICFIASIISLWFGFSFIMLQHFCLFLFRKTYNFFNKYKIRNNISLKQTNNLFIEGIRKSRAVVKKF